MNLEEYGKEGGKTLTTIFKKGQTPIININHAQKARKEFALEVKYHEIYLNDKEPVWFRKKLAEYAWLHGIKPAMREFGCSRNTVRKWCRSEDYKNRSKAPKNSPRRISEEQEQEIIACRLKEFMGPTNLKYQYKIPVSVSTVYRVLQRNNKIKPRKRKWKQTKDLRAYKAKLKAFEVIQVDGKVLTDILEFYPFYAKYSLPRLQFTATCEKTGASFYSYASGESSLAGCTFVVYLLEHLKRYGIKVRKIKTDKGSYAVHRNSLKRTNFERLLKDIYQIKHQANVHKNQNADVERFHGLIEQYFYKITEIKDKNDFYKKAYEKHIWFNYIRKNGYKNWATPLGILKKDYPKMDPQVLTLPPIDLDQHSDIYMYKANPNYSPITPESFFRDVPDEYLEQILKPEGPARLLSQSAGGGQHVMKLDDPDLKILKLIKKTYDLLTD